MKDYNYLYYEHEAGNAWELADDKGDYERAQLHMLDTIARSLACIADALEHANGITEPKEADYDIGSAE